MEESQTTRNELIDFEQQGWHALSSTADAAADFYERVLDHTVLMVLPGGLVLDERAEIVASMAGPPWSSFELQEPREVNLTDDTVVVQYGVIAHRADAPTYSALMSSVYVRREDGWKLAFHQQTPR